MLGLPTATEVHKQLPKKAIYAKLQMNTTAKTKMDADISRITISNEISLASVHIAEGERVKKFYVVQIALKKKAFDEKTIAALSKLISQNMLFVLEYDNEEKLAIYHTKLMQTPWKPKEGFSLLIKGLTLDAVWENIIVQVGGVEIECGNTLDEQIETDTRRQNLEKEINRLDKLTRKEKQPKKKFELHQRINQLKKELDG